MDALASTMVQRMPEQSDADILLDLPVLACAFAKLKMPGRMFQGKLGTSLR